MGEGSVFMRPKVTRTKTLRATLLRSYNSKMAVRRYAPGHPSFEINKDLDSRKAVTNFEN
jgi:hypothetical protein